MIVRIFRQSVSAMATLPDIMNHHHIRVGSHFKLAALVPFLTTL